MKTILLMCLMIAGGLQVCNAQNNLTVREAFNFDIGDEFQYETEVIKPMVNKLERRIILGKWTSGNNDTLFYRIRVNARTSWMGGSSDTPPYEEIRHYANADSLVWSPAVADFLCSGYDSCIVMAEYGDFCGKDFVFIQRRSGKIGFEEEKYNIQYTRGLGITRLDHIIEDGGVSGNIEKMIYYKKGNDSCGTSQLAGKFRNDYSGNFKVFPVPSRDFITISDLKSLDKGRLIVYDLNGSVKIKQFIAPGNILIDIRDLQPGVYLITMEQAGSRMVSKFIKAE